MTSVKRSRQAVDPAWGWGHSYRAQGNRWEPNPSCSLQGELQSKVEEEQLRLELQMVETERVRLSLLEEKLVDVLQLLQRLQDLVGPVAPRAGGGVSGRGTLPVSVPGSKPSHHG